jgi:predicted nucleotidyltransferase
VPKALNAGTCQKFKTIGKNDTLDKKIPLKHNSMMDIFTDRINNIKASILKFVPAKYIYLFGSYAYGNPTEKSDIDIYVVTPDNINNHTELYGKIIGDLSEKDIFFIDFIIRAGECF